MGWRKALMPFRDQRKPICEVAVAAFHEPPPHPVPLPIRWGEGGRRPGEGRFMVPMHAEKRKGALHEPAHPWPLPGGELSKRAPILTPLLRRGRGWVQGPMDRSYIHHFKPPAWPEVADFVAPGSIRNELNSALKTK